MKLETALLRRLRNRHTPKFRLFLWSGKLLAGIPVWNRLCINLYYYTSNYVLQELLRAEEPKRSDMIGLIDKYKMRLLEADEIAERLADEYVEAGIIPQKYKTDGIHIAMATINDLDIIVSYNFQHIVKLKTIIGTESINLREGYKRIGIYSPTEVIENEE